MSFLKRLMPLKAERNVNLENHTVENGQPFKGTAILTPKEVFKVEMVRIEARINETWEEPVWERDSNGVERQQLKRMEDVLYKQDLPVSQAFDAAGGESKEFPFQVILPMRNATRAGGSVSYSLKAVADIKGRPDVTKTINPFVIQALSPMPMQAAQATQAAREVVKVPCSFCGTLVEITGAVNKCPSCGAPLQLR